MKEESKSVISFIPKKSGFRITFSTKMYYKKSSSGQGFIVFVPGLDIHFYAPSKEEISNKTDVICKMYFDHFLKHSGKQGIKKLALELHRKGFKSSGGNGDLQSLLNNQFLKTKFVGEQSVLNEDIKNLQALPELELEVA
jgi:hypothetical protein